jgi:hypothetical protein
MCPHVAVCARALPALIYPQGWLCEQGALVRLPGACSVVDSQYYRDGQVAVLVRDGEECRLAMVAAEGVAYGGLGSDEVEGSDVHQVRDGEGCVWGCT